MKKTYLFLALISLVFSLTSTKIDPSNPPTGSTGAPSENTCGKTNCHAGGTFTGTVSIAGVPDTILANTTYSVTLTQASGATRAGFQLTCLDKANAKCGTLAAATGVNVTTASNRQYARQSAAKTLSNGSVSWTFSWKSPATLPADSIKFYFASLAADGDGKKTNDNPLLGIKKVITTATSATGEISENTFAKIYPTVVSENLNVEINGANSAELTIFDQNGRALTRQTVGNGRQVLSVSTLSKGVFIAKLATADGRSMTARLVKN